MFGNGNGRGNVTRGTVPGIGGNMPAMSFVVSRRVFGRDVSSSSFAVACDRDGTYNPDGRYVRARFGARVSAVIVAVPASRGRRAAFIVDAIDAADALSSAGYRSIAGRRTVDMGAVIVATGTHAIPTDVATLRTFIDARDTVRRATRNVVSRHAAASAFIRGLDNADADATTADAATA